VSLTVRIVYGVAVAC